MSKGLEALEELKTTCDTWLRPSINNLQDDRFIIIKKELKALEIIKEIMPIGEEDFFYDEETDTYFFIGYKVSKEEFDLLKEILQND